MSKTKKLRKARFALPSLVTLGSVFCSFLSMSYVVRGMALAADARLHCFNIAALAILGSIIFDLFDGKVARWTHTSTKFGMELDSLADGVSFGVAPAVLIYGFVLQYAGVFGIIAGFLYIAGALLRLARFNIEVPEEGVQTYFKGLASPAGAAGISAIVLASIDINFTTFTRFEANTFACIAIALGLMMISNIRYKTLKGNKTTADKIVVVCGVLFFITMCMIFSPAKAFFMLYCYFIAWGLLLTVYLILKRDPYTKRRRRLQSLALMEPVKTPPQKVEKDDEDDEDKNKAKNKDDEDDDDEDDEDDE